MSRNTASRNVGAAAYFVNAISVLIAVSVIGAGYFTALGQFAGIV